jgi:hypothetical protein
VGSKVTSLPGGELGEALGQAHELLSEGRLACVIVGEWDPKQGKLVGWSRASHPELGQFEAMGMLQDVIFTTSMAAQTSEDFERGS